jgi:hypothetical protein
LVVGIALLRDYAHLATFTIPETLLGILGISQVVYIGGVLAKPPSYAELNAALDRLRTLELKAESARLTGQDTDLEGNVLPRRLDAPQPKGVDASAQALPNVHILITRQANQVARMIETKFGVPVDPATLWSPPVADEKDETPQELKAA